MSFAAIPGAVKLEKLFDFGPPRPMSFTELEFSNERRFVRQVIFELEKLDAQIILALEGQIPVHIVPDALRHVDPSRLRVSLFDVLAFELEKLRDYDGAAIWIEKSIFDDVSRSLRIKRLEASAAVVPNSLAEATRQIVRAYDNGELTTKKQARIDFGAGLSERGFAHAWKSAAEQRSDISRPGRRPKS